MSSLCSKDTNVKLHLVKSLLLLGSSPDKNLTPKTDSRFFSRTKRTLWPWFSNISILRMLAFILVWPQHRLERFPVPLNCLLRVEFNNYWRWFLFFKRFFAILLFYVENTTGFKPNSLLSWSRHIGVNLCFVILSIDGAANVYKPFCIMVFICCWLKRLANLFLRRHLTYQYTFKHNFSIKCRFLFSFVPMHIFSTKLL